MNDEMDSLQTPPSEEQQAQQAQQKQPKALSPQAASIARRLREARRAAGLTQVQLAGKEFSKGYISAIECGKILPSLDALALLAHRLGVTRAYLLGEGKEDLETLKHDWVLLGSLSQAHSQGTKKATERLLSQAHALLRDDHWPEALHVLGEGQVPPNDLFGLDLLDWYWLIGWALVLAQRPDNARGLLQDGLKLAERLRPLLHSSQQERLAEAVVRLNHFLGSALCALGQTLDALEFHQRCREAILAGAVRDPELQLFIYTGLGRDLLVLGRYKEAITAYKDAAQQAEDQRNPRQRGLVFWGLGVVYQKSGDLQSAKASFLQAVEALEEHNDLRLLAKARNLLGHVLVHLGEMKAAERQFRLSLEVVRPLKDTVTWGYILGNLAEMYLKQGKWEDAIEAAQAGVKVVAQSRDVRNEGQLHRQLSSVYEAQENHAATEQALKAAIALFEAIAHYDLLTETRADYIRLLESQGRYEEAYKQIRLLGPEA
ncbi:MAG TPA: tetratricopeptide repeat protein [Ktedonobacterales bacterium]|jgi:tetratricopeptide (TPR) repeat protein